MSNIKNALYVLMPLAIVMVLALMTQYMLKKSIPDGVVIKDCNWAEPNEADPNAVITIILEPNGVEIVPVYTVRNDQYTYPSDPNDIIYQHSLAPNKSWVDQVGDNERTRIFYNIGAILLKINDFERRLRAIEDPNQRKEE